MTTPIKPVALIVPLVAAVAVLALPLPLTPAGHRALAIGTWMVVSWLLEPIHAGIVGLTGCFLFWVAKCGPFDASFAGFGTEVPWFVYGGLTLVSAVRLAGLDRRLGGLLPIGGGSFLSAAFTLTLLALALGFVVPSAGARAIILGCVALGLGDRLDRGGSRPSRAALVAIASYAAAVLGADGGDAPPLAWRLITVVVVSVVAARFVRPARIEGIVPPVVPAPDGGLVGLVFAAATLAWLTTPWHGVAPAVVGLAAGCLVSFPGFRPRGSEVPKADPLAVILAGTAVSLPLVLNATGASAALATAFQGWVTASSALGARLTTYLGYVAVGLFTPLRMLVAGPATGAVAPTLSPTTLDWIAACAATTKLALYQSPALIVGASIAELTTRDVLKFGAALMLAGAIASLAF